MAAAHGEARNRQAAATSSEDGFEAATLDGLTAAYPDRAAEIAQLIRGANQ